MSKLNSSENLRKPLPQGRSPIEAAFLDLQAVNPTWRVEIGLPEDSSKWIHGKDLIRATEGPFHDLLCRIGERARSNDRRTIAASFALHFGWTSSVAIAPYLIHHCVPDVTLGNISFKFRDDTWFECCAIHSPCGSVIGEGSGNAPLTTAVENHASLRAVLRSTLKEQASQVVEALHVWSGFSRKGSWGQITSSWAAQFVNIYDTIGEQAEVLPEVEAFFQGDDEIARMQPRLHPVTIGEVTHLYQRRASCCRYYLWPQGSLCASCPLVSQEERVARNLDWMKELLRRKEKTARAS
jgi:FhuF-like iron-sulfur protein